MADDVLALFHSSNHVAVHDLNVVNIEEQFETIGVDLSDNLSHPVEVIALVTGMSLHRMRVVAGVEMLQDRWSPSSVPHNLRFA